MSSPPPSPTHPARLAARAAALGVGLAALLVGPALRESGPTFTYARDLGRGACIVEAWAHDADGPRPLDPEDLFASLAPELRERFRLIRTRETDAAIRALCRGMRATGEASDVHAVLRCAERDRLVVVEDGRADVCRTHEDASHRGRDVVVEPPPMRPPKHRPAGRREGAGYNPVRSRYRGGGGR